MLDFIKALVAREPARLVGWGSTLAIAGALYVAGLFGITLDAEVIAAVGVIAGFVIAELIRRFVYAPATTQAIAEAATFQAAGTAVDIGKPPEGPAAVAPEGG